MLRHHLNGMSTALESHKAPIHIGSVTLRARDMAGLAAFYEDKLGLDRISATADRVAMGSGGVAYLNVDAAPSATIEPESAAGLFHTAFLLPDRASLGRWFLRTHGAGVRFEGASDHAVSEAFYLSDPEGNGIEVYHDRPRSEWRPDGAGGVHMTTARMDIGAVVAAGQALANDDGRFPANARIGHVHLKVGDADEAERFFASAFGLDVTHRRRPDAVFLSSGGYHHHLAANTWMSRGASRRAEGAAGLAELAFEVSDPALKSAIANRMGGSVFTDPWGTHLTV
jgi:catechol 2,3-dioxygenase